MDEIAKSTADERSSPAVASRPADPTGRLDYAECLPIVRQRRWQLAGAIVLALMVALICFRLVPWSWRQIRIIAAQRACLEYVQRPLTLTTKPARCPEWDRFARAFFGSSAPVQIPFFMHERRSPSGRRYLAVVVAQVKKAPGSSHLLIDFQWGAITVATPFTSAKLVGSTFQWSEGFQSRWPAGAQVVSEIDPRDPSHFIMRLGTPGAEEVFDGYVREDGIHFALRDRELPGSFQSN